MAYSKIGEGEATKLCRGCNLAHLLTNFSKAKNCKDGLQSRCRTCASVTYKARYARRVEKRKVEAAPQGRSCAGCRQWRSIEHFGPCEHTECGIDTFCRGCRSTLAVERGLRDDELSIDNLTPAEVIALALMRTTRDKARRTRKMHVLDWSDYLDMLERLKTPVKKRLKVDWEVALIDPKSYYVVDNVRVQKKK
jgi:hypothetical protein